MTLRETVFKDFLGAFEVERMASKNNGGSKDDDEMVTMLFRKLPETCQTTKMILTRSLQDIFKTKAHVIYHSNMLVSFLH